MTAALLHLPPSVGQVAVPIPGTRDTVLHLGLDPAEHGRRQLAGLGGIASWSALDLLMELPVGEAIPIGALAWDHRPQLRRLPAGVAVVSRTHITRLAVRPCRVHRAVIAGTATRRNLERVSRFAPFCNRTLLIPKPPRRADFLTEADFYGIGVAVEHEDGGHEVLVVERPWIPKRHTVAGWRFAEVAYGRALLAPMNT